MSALVGTNRPEVVDADDWLHSARPSLRRGVRVGPELLEGARRVHVVYDPASEAYLRIGVKEAFLLRRMDGTATVAEIGAAYAAQFGRRLAAGNWAQLLALLHRHELTEPSDPVRLAELRTATLQRRRAAGRTLWHYRIPVPGMTRLLARVAPAAGWLLTPTVVVVGCLLGLAGSFALASDFGEIARTAGTGYSVSASLAAFVTWWLVVLAHELAHGMACLRYGGQPTEIGIMWRFPLLAPYCKVDDIFTFDRGQRVMTSFAGVYVHIAAQAPIALIWNLAQPDSWAHHVIAVIAAMNLISIVVNLVPVLHLDGYHMLEGWLSCLRLQTQSFTYVGSLIGRAGSPRADYSARARRIYLGYSLLAASIIIPLVAAVLTLWYRTLAPYVGAAGALATLATEAAILGILGRWAARRRVRRAQDQEARALANV